MFDDDDIVLKVRHNADYDESFVRPCEVSQKLFPSKRIRSWHQLGRVILLNLYSSKMYVYSLRFRQRVLSVCMCLVSVSVSEACRKKQVQSIEYQQQLYRIQL